MNNLIIGRQTNNKKGVAIFFVLFVMVILGILITQFHLSSRQAQNSVHRFQTSEMARQLAAAAQEEAFKYLYDQTNNPNSTDYDKLDSSSILRKIIDKKSIYVTDFKRTSSNCIKIEVPATIDMAKRIMGDRMEIIAEARIVDFRDRNYDKVKFYKNEGIGTIEIVTTAKAKDKYKKNFPGACTIVRHHDYKVVSLLSKKERDAEYAGNRVLDYALFIRQGQKEFEDSKSLSLNPKKNVQLEINAGSVSPLPRGPCGTGSGSPARR